jgi:hypothetical protein
LFALLRSDFKNIDILKNNFKNNFKNDHRNLILTDFKNIFSIFHQIDVSQIGRTVPYSVSLFHVTVLYPTSYYSRTQEFSVLLPNK